MARAGVAAHAAVQVAGPDVEESMPGRRSFFERRRKSALEILPLRCM
jgi:hypothetical protein